MPLVIAATPPSASAIAVLSAVRLSVGCGWITRGAGTSESTAPSAVQMPSGSQGVFATRLKVMSPLPVGVSVKM